MKINKETVVRYIYGVPIAEMITDSFGYKLEIEERVNEQSMVNVSSRSRTDYCCWKLYKEKIYQIYVQVWTFSSQSISNNLWNSKF